MFLFTILFLFFVGTYGSEQQKCDLRHTGNGKSVCVCSADYCDTIPKLNKLEQSEFVVYTSNKKGLRFEMTKGNLQRDTNTGNNTIILHQDEVFQEILGWGGAFTDSTGVNILSLNKTAQDLLLKSYFSDDGLEYNLCRVPIGGTDFSDKNYTYDDGKWDPQLSNFKLASEDYDYKIPIIKRALALSGEGNLKFFASAWHAPQWMTTEPFSFLKQDVYESWSNYFMKFLEAYTKEGIPFWGITTGNEPSLGLSPVQSIPDLGWTPPLMAHWILTYLGPSLRKLFPDTHLLILDDQRYFLPWFIDAALQNKETRDYVDGIAVHFYADQIFSPILLDETHNHFPEKFLLSTEGCTGVATTDSVDLGSWERGETYATDIIEDLLHWVGGWIDWNMALDTKGGPTYVNNNVDSPIIVDALRGEFYKQPMYYVLGHFSKFITRGSVRIGINVSDSTIEAVAFKRLDHSVAVLILNTNEEDHTVTIIDKNKGGFTINVTAKSINTAVYA